VSVRLPGLRLWLCALLCALGCAGLSHVSAQNSVTETRTVTRVGTPGSPLPELPPQDVRVSLPSNQALRVESVGGGTPAWFPALITGIGALLTSLIALTATLMAVAKSNRQNAENTTRAIAATTTSAQNAVNQKANELEIASIEHRLSNFFGPFMQLSAENKRLAGLLRARQPSANFRTLRALLDQEWKPSETDQQLLDKIVENGLTLRGLIREKAGPVSPILMPFLSRASAHFTILALAHARALTEKTEEFAAYVYPRQLDGVLDLECGRLVERRDTLRADLSRQHAAATDLIVPEELAMDEPAHAETPSATAAS
jgi:hypothetical protein